MKILINNKQKLDKMLIKSIKKISVRIIKALKFPKSSVLSLVFCNDKSIQAINKQHREIDEPTDVLSFPMPRNDFEGGSDKVILGDIVVSVETAQKQANELKHSFNAEIAFLIIHGLLHLNGYDHLKEDEREIMSKKETELYKILCRAGLVHDYMLFSSGIIGRTKK